MAKKQKPQASKSSKGFGTKNLAPELQKAIALAAREKWAEARDILERLSEDYPNNTEILLMLSNCCYEMQDMLAFQRVSEQLVELEPNNADAVFALGQTYLTNSHFLLALQTLKSAIARWSDYPNAEEIKEIISKIESQVDELLGEAGLVGEAGLEIAILHERGQAALEVGNYAKARQLEEQVLQHKPDFGAASNNLSLIEFLQDNIEGAIAICHQVLEAQPNNIRALSNLVRYYCLMGRLDEAQQIVDRLKASQASAWDAWTKKMEGFSFLGDDQSIVEVFQQAEKEGDLEIASAMFFHLAGVAFARLGQPSEARKQWKKALEISPGFELARSNLDNLNRMTGEPAWAFPFSHWFTPTALEAVEKAMRSAQSSEKAFQKSMQICLQDHPEIKSVIPILFDRGDPAGQHLAFVIASNLATPEFLEMLKDFALSQRGSDSMRHEAAIQVAEAGLLPTENVRMWLQGEWREISLISYEFYDESPYKRSKKANDLMRAALNKLRFGDKAEAEEAEQLLRQVLELYPDAPDVLQNIAASYDIQERTEDMLALTQEIIDRFPNYVPARASMARYHLHNKNIEAADALLKPMISRKRWHVDDFATFSNSYLQLLLAQKETKAAQIWLNLWAGVEPDRIDVQQWQRRLAPSSLLDDLEPLTRLKR
jgi:tetratricopeptide (TPR) repeat protein